MIISLVFSTPKLKRRRLIIWVIFSSQNLQFPGIFLRVPTAEDHIVLAVVAIQDFIVLFKTLLARTMIKMVVKIKSVT